MVLISQVSLHLSLKKNNYSCSYCYKQSSFHLIYFVFLLWFLYSHYFPLLNLQVTIVMHLWWSCTLIILAHSTKWSILAGERKSSSAPRKLSEKIQIKSFWKKFLLIIQRISYINIGYPSSQHPPAPQLHIFSFFCCSRFNLTLKSEIWFICFQTSQFSKSWEHKKHFCVCRDPITF